MSKRLLSMDDRRLIALCKQERTRLREQLAQLSDRALAVKFGVSHRTISRE